MLYKSIKTVFLSLFALLTVMIINAYPQEIITTPDTSGGPVITTEEPTTIPIDTTKPPEEGIKFEGTTSTKTTQKTVKYVFKEDPKDPTSWAYFRITAKKDEADIFTEIQDVFKIKPYLETFVLTADFREGGARTVQIGEGDEAPSVPLDAIPDSTLMKLIMWRGANKVNLSKTGYNWGSVFIDWTKNIRIDDFLSPPAKEREIVNSIAYINPYLNFFGGDPLGIPLKRGFGFSFQLGTPYSGPFETDLVAGNFHLVGASIGIGTRIKELVFKRQIGATTGEQQSTFGKYNNVFVPKLILQVNYVVPFGNFLQIGFLSVLDTGDYDPPLLIKDNTSADTNAYMPNNVLSKRTYINFEVRYPFKVFRSTRAKIYFAKYLGEFHAGFVGRELTIGNTIFDLRMNVTFGSSVRNTQFLWEAYVSSIGEGFGQTAFAMGPSVRLTRSPDGGIGVVTVMINARLKIGDFFDEK